MHAPHPLPSVDDIGRLEIAQVTQQLPDQRNFGHAALGHAAGQGDDAAAFKPERATVVGVRAFVDGRTVSHMVKATRGDVARLLLSSAEQPETPEDVAAIVRAAGHEVELSGSGRTRSVDILA